VMDIEALLEREDRSFYHTLLTSKLGLLTTTEAADDEVLTREIEKYKLSLDKYARKMINLRLTSFWALASRDPMLNISVLWEDNTPEHAPVDQPGEALVEDQQQGDLLDDQDDGGSDDEYGVDAEAAIEMDNSSDNENSEEDEGAVFPMSPEDLSRMHRNNINSIRLISERRNRRNR
jgi:hypothetical protein